MTSPLDATPVLSPDDKRAEATRLGVYDVAHLRERIQRSLQRRAFVGGFATGIVTAFGVAVLTWAVSGSRTAGPGVVLPEPKAACAAVSTTTTRPMAPPLVPPAPAPFAVPAPRVVIREVRVEVPGACPLPAARAVDDDDTGVEGSPLRTQLRIFADAERALVDGDPARALARATHLQAQFGSGPLQIDAMLLEIRALRALGRVDEAHEALTRAEAHAQATEKAEVLHELRALLGVHDAGDSSHDADTLRDAGQLNPEAPGADRAPSAERSPQ
jgi:hypothetical protein